MPRPNRAALSLLLILALCACLPALRQPYASPYTPTPSLAPSTPQPGEPTWTPSPVPFNPTATINFETPNPGANQRELQHVQLENRLVVAAKFQKHAAGCRACGMCSTKCLCWMPTAAAWRRNSGRSRGSCRADQRTLCVHLDLLAGAEAARWSCALPAAPPTRN
jgi:hypothetical protein